MKNNILITGGAGFLGSALACALVEEGNHVVILDNFLRGNKLDRRTQEACSILEGDVRDEFEVARAMEGIDICYHLAAVLGVDVVAAQPLETMATEIEGMINVVKGAVLNRSKIIYASTSGVYGKAAIEQAVHEDFPVSPSSSYGIAKRYNELYLQALWTEKRVESISVRLFNVYGPTQDDRMVIPRFTQAANADGELRIYEDGKQTRDFTYIDDVVMSLMDLRKVGGCEIVNVATGVETSISELAKLVISIRGQGTSKIVGKAPGREEFEVKRRAGDCAKLGRLVDRVPGFPLIAGLSRCVRV
jgi:UDP-glucose 4-epimerase